MNGKFCAKVQLVEHDSEKMSTNWLGYLNSQLVERR